MAENGKTKIILTVIIGLFGVMCFGFALTVTDKYKTARDKVAVLEKKFEAGKNELLKIPELKEKVINAEEQAKGALEELESVQEELDETSEELDAVTEELENLQAEMEEGAADEEEGEGEESEEAKGDEELISQLEGANEQIESLRVELVSAEEIIQGLRSKSTTEAITGSKATSGSAVVGFTFNGSYNVDPQAKIGNIKEVHRGLKYHRRVKSKPAVVTTISDEKDTKQLVKNRVDTINSRLSELLTYAGEKTTTRRDRIGVQAYTAGLGQRSLEEQNKIASALNDVLTNYTSMYKVISHCRLFTSRERGLAKNSLNKRISNYVGQLLSKNQSGGFSSDDKDVQLLLSKIQNEQKYFLN